MNPLIVAGIIGSPSGPSLGPELVTSGNFSSGTGWTLSAGFTIGSGLLSINSASGNAQNAFLAQSGKQYEITVDIVSLSGGSINVTVGNSAETISTPGLKTFRKVASVNNYLYILVNTGTVVSTIDSISVKEVL